MSKVKVNLPSLNKVELKIDALGKGETYLNGTKLEFVKSVSMKSAVNQETLVTIELLSGFELTDDRE